MWQNKRSYTREILDAGPDHYSSQEYHQCLRLLQRVNRLLGGFSASKSAFSQLTPSPQSILDVGCGGGSLCQHLHRWLPEARIVGMDINPAAIDHANAACPKPLAKAITFEIQKTPQLLYPDQSFAVVTSMLVCHHMTDEELIVFLKDCYRICSQAVIVNDLQRHFLAYLSFSLIAPLVFRNRLIWHDGRLSIRRAFRKRDWLDILGKAGFTKDQYTLRWHWAFRWTLTIHRT